MLLQILPSVPLPTNTISTTRSTWGGRRFVGVFGALFLTQTPKRKRLGILTAFIVTSFQSRRDWQKAGLNIHLYRLSLKQYCRIAGWLDQCRSSAVTMLPFL